MAKPSTVRLIATLLCWLPLSALALSVNTYPDLGSRQADAHFARLPKPRARLLQEDDPDQVCVEGCFAPPTPLADPYPLLIVSSTDGTPISLQDCYDTAKRSTSFNISYIAIIDQYSCFGGDAMPGGWAEYDGACPLGCVPNATVSGPCGGTDVAAVFSFGKCEYPGAPCSPTLGELPPSPPAYPPSPPSPPLPPYPPSLPASPPPPTYPGIPTTPPTVPEVPPDAPPVPSPPELSIPSPSPSGFPGYGNSPSPSSYPGNLPSPTSYPGNSPSPSSYPGYYASPSPHGGYGGKLYECRRDKTVLFGRPLASLPRKRLNPEHTTEENIAKCRSICDTTRGCSGFFYKTTTLCWLFSEVFAFTDTTYSTAVVACRVI